MRGCSDHLWHLVTALGLKQLVLAARFDDFDLACDLQQILVVTQVSTHDRPLVHERVFYLGVPCVQI